jgi:hypothetical protein
MFGLLFDPENGSDMFLRISLVRTTEELLEGKVAAPV